WVWLHLLQFDVSNQTLDPEEDKKNKNDRPLPSGRLSHRAAVRLRWILVLICWGYSYFYSYQVLWVSIALVALTAIYDELGFHSKHYILRNLVNALGFAAFETGSALVKCNVEINSITLSTCIFFTTIQTQDFKDVNGDASVGRKTLPITHPFAARVFVAMGMFGWCCALAWIW
ncbi:hypothetical protein M422DRAFT_108208, partial [Sphaerobolus stellatus SS14]